MLDLILLLGTAKGTDIFAGVNEYQSTEDLINVHVLSVMEGVKLEVQDS